MCHMQHVVVSVPGTIRCSCYVCRERSAGDAPVQFEDLADPRNFESWKCLAIFSANETALAYQDGLEVIEDDAKTGVGIYLIHTETLVSPCGGTRQVYKIGVTDRDLRERVRHYRTYLWEPTFLSALMFRPPLATSLEDLKDIEGRMKSVIDQLPGWQRRGEKFSYLGQGWLPPQFLGILFLKAENRLQLQEA